MNFDPQKSLFALPIVRKTIYVVLALSAFFTVVIALNTELPFCFSGEGFNHAMLLFRLPLGLLAVGLTLVGIYGANHRSEQTKRQIERTFEQITLTNLQIKKTDSQNIFSNYYKHIEEFTKYCEVHGGKERFSAPRHLYAKIFNKSYDGDYSINETFVNDLNLFVDSILIESDDFKSHSSVMDAIQRVVRARDRFAENLRLMPLTVQESDTSFTYSGKSHLITGGSSPAVMQSISYLIESVDIALQFDSRYVATREVDAFKKLDVKYISPIKLDNQKNPFDLKRAIGLE